MRSKAIVLLITGCLVAIMAAAQSNELIVKGGTGKLYLEHTVVAKENWYSVGRLYNLSPKEIAPFNNLTLDKSLSIGQHLEIPLTAVNFSQDGQKAAGESLIPVYHVVQEKEWMYRVSVNYNKVPMANLEKWNNVNKDQVKAGMKLIVGYLKVKTALSAFAGGGGVPAAATGTTVNNSGAASGQVVAAAHKDPPSPVHNDTPASATFGSSTTVAATGNVPAGSSTSGSAPAPSSSSPAVSSSSQAASTSSSNPAASSSSPAASSSGPGSSSSAQGASIAGSTTSSTSSTAPATVTPASSVPVAPVHSDASAGHATPHFNGGYFKSDFSGGSNSTSGLAGTFKSTSGWQDGKYYALMNGVAVGTIVKVSLASTGKSVYAKVLGQLPDMKESAGLAIRISNAAAAELGGIESRFSVDVKY